MTRILILLGLGLIVVIGWVRTRRQLTRLQERIDFAKSCRLALGKYITSRGKDLDAYGELTYNSVRMQRELGSLGVMHHYKPPGHNFIITRCDAF